MDGGAKGFSKDSCGISVLLSNRWPPTTGHLASVSNPAQGRRSSRARPGRPGLQHSWRSRPLVHSLVARRLCSKIRPRAGICQWPGSCGPRPWVIDRHQDISRREAGRGIFTCHPPQRETTCAAKDMVHSRRLSSHGSKMDPKEQQSASRKLCRHRRRGFCCDVIALKGTSARSTASQHSQWIHLRLTPWGINLPARVASHPHAGQALWSGLDEQDRGLAEPARPSPLEACISPTKGAVSNPLGRPLSPQAPQLVL